MITIIKGIIVAILSTDSIKSTILELAWTSFIAYFGDGSSSRMIDKNSFKATMITSLFGGMVIWIAYQSFLTADLAIQGGHGLSF